MSNLNTFPLLEAGILSSQTHNQVEERLRAHRVRRRLRNHTKKPKTGLSGAPGGQKQNSLQREASDAYLRTFSSRRKDENTLRVHKKKHISIREKNLEDRLPRRRKIRNNKKKLQQGRLKLDRPAEDLLWKKLQEYLWNFTQEGCRRLNIHVSNA